MADGLINKSNGDTKSETLSNKFQQNEAFQRADFVDFHNTKMENVRLKEENKILRDKMEEFKEENARFKEDFAEMTSHFSDYREVYEGNAIYRKFMSYELNKPRERLGLDHDVLVEQALEEKRIQESLTRGRVRSLAVKLIFEEDAWKKYDLYEKDNLNELDKDRDLKYEQNSEEDIFEQSSNHNAAIDKQSEDTLPHSEEPESVAGLNENEPEEANATSVNIGATFKEKDELTGKDDQVASASPVSENATRATTSKAVHKDSIDDAIFDAYKANYDKEHREILQKMRVDLPTPSFYELDEHHLYGDFALKLTIGAEFVNDLQIFKKPQNHKTVRIGTGRGRPSSTASQPQRGNKRKFGDRSSVSSGHSDSIDDITNNEMSAKRTRKDSNDSGSSDVPASQKKTAYEEFLEIQEAALKMSPSKGTLKPRQTRSRTSRDY